eukprot:gene31211-6360_t
MLNSPAQKARSKQLGKAGYAPVPAAPEEVRPISAALGGLLQDPSMSDNPPAALLRNFKQGPNVKKQALVPGGQ